MNYQLMDFFSKTMDLTDKKTIQECTRIVEQKSNPINEAEQNTVILSLTSRLYKMIVDKADDIDFGQIPNTNGDVTKLKEYPQINYAVVLAYIPGKQNEYDNYSDTMLPEGIESVHPRYAISWRNNWMLRQSDYVITYITHSWGGAAQYAAKAARQGKTVINLADIENDALEK